MTCSTLYTVGLHLLVTVKRHNVLVRAKESLHSTEHTVELPPTSLARSRLVGITDVALTCGRA
jgi:hypothetical protein